MSDDARELLSAVDRALATITHFHGREHELLPEDDEDADDQATQATPAPADARDLLRSVESTLDLLAKAYRREGETPAQALYRLVSTNHPDAAEAMRLHAAASALIAR